MKLKSTRQSLNLIGQFVKYDCEDGYKIKRLNLLTADGMQSVELTKEARACLFRLNSTTTIVPGTLLSLAVEAKLDGDAMQYKVYDLQILTAPVLDLSPNHPVTKIRVCDRGTCRKRGATDVYAQLQRSITDRGLGDQVVLERTGCLNNCKHGPNVAVGQICHSEISPSEAAQLLVSH